MTMMNEQDVLGECKRLDSQGLYRDAVRLLSEAIASKPSDKLLHERGVRYEDLGEYQAAFEDYSAAASLSPSSVLYWLERGRLAYSRLRLAAEAIDAFEKAISADPTSPDPHQHLSLCYLSLGDVDGAYEHATTAIQLDTADAFSHYCLGKSLLATEEEEFAEEQFEIAARLDPQDSLFWRALGGVYRKSGKAAKSLECYKKAVELEPWALGYITMAEIEFDLGNPKEAVVHLNLASEFALDEGEQVLIDSYLSRARDMTKGT